MFQKQKIMRRVVYSLIPIYLFSLYLYGWRLLSHTAVIFAVGILMEYIMTKRKNKKVSEAVLVTCALYVLSLPPTTPLWISLVGIIFAILIAKEAFGGFGRNIFNPAIAGRLFIYLTFPSILSVSWMVPGMFGTSGTLGVDAITAATPLASIRAGQMPDLLNLVTGLRSGSFGESPIILILLAGVYLIATKTASWRLMLSTLVSGLLLTTIFYLTGLIPGMSPSNNTTLVTILSSTAIYLFSGSFLFMVVFMCTDPVTSPNKPWAQIVYGLIVGSVAILVRCFSGFPEGVSFGIFIGNTFASLLDEIIPKKKARKKEVATA